MQSVNSLSYAQILISHFALPDHEKRSEAFKEDTDKTFMIITTQNNQRWEPNMSEPHMNHTQGTRPLQID